MRMASGDTPAGLDGTLLGWPPRVTALFLWFPRWYVDPDAAGHVDVVRWSEEFDWRQDAWNGLRDTVDPVAGVLETASGDCDDYAVVVASRALARGRDPSLVICRESGDTFPTPSPSGTTSGSTPPARSTTTRTPTSTSRRATTTTIASGAWPDCPPRTRRGRSGESASLTAATANTSTAGRSPPTAFFPDTNRLPMQRRGYLALPAAGLAGCSGGDGDAATPTATSTGTRTPTRPRPG